MTDRHRTVLAAAICGLLLLAPGFLRAQPGGGVPGPAQLMGTWRGRSTCTDRVAAPACNDETVIYEFTTGSKPGTVHWVAHKVVNGQRERTGELDLTYDKTDACWKVEVSSPRFKTVWRLKVDGARLSGTAQSLPGNETIRKLELRKEPTGPPAASNARFDALASLAETKMKEYGVP